MPKPDARRPKWALVLLGVLPVVWILTCFLGPFDQDCLGPHAGVGFSASPWGLVARIGWGWHSGKWMRAKEQTGLPEGRSFGCDLLGFTLIYRVYSFYGNNGETNAHWIDAGLPLWLLIAAAAWRLIRRPWKRRRTASRLRAQRAARWRCTDCGYDLRASRAKCPECGKAFTPRFRPPTPAAALRNTEC